MDTCENGGLRISLAETGILKQAARLVPDNDVALALAHYRGVQQHHVEDKRVFRFNLNDRLREFQDELIGLPRMMESVNGSRSVDDLRYIIGPKLARAAIDAVEVVLDNKLIIPTHTQVPDEVTRRVATALNLRDTYFANAS